MQVQSKQREHGLVFYAFAYGFGGVYAIGQIALQGLGKVYERAWDAAFLIGGAGASGLYQVYKTMEFAGNETLCVAAMVRGCVKPFFKAGLDGSGAFFLEIWKALKSVASEIGPAIEMPWSIVRDVIKQLFFATGSGFDQIGVVIGLIVNVIRDLYKFGIVGSIVKQCFKCLQSGLHETFKFLVFAWNNTDIPRRFLVEVLSELWKGTCSGFNEIGKAIYASFKESFFALRIPLDIITTVLIQTMYSLGDGIIQLAMGIFWFLERVGNGFEIPVEIAVLVLRVLNDGIVSGIMEIVNFFQFFKEDLGDSLNRFVINPIAPYAKQVYDKINELLEDMQRVVGQIQEFVFGK